MSGRGFARRVTLENLEVFRPLLKRPISKADPEEGGQDEQGETSEDEQESVEVEDDAEAAEFAEAEQQFQGERLRFSNPFRRRRRTPPPTGQSAGTPGGVTPPAQPAPTAVLTADYEQFWASKPLTERDLNVPIGQTTHQTGSINLDKGQLPEAVDHRHYFRDVIFDQLDWEPSRSPTVDEARASFELVVLGTRVGEFPLRIGHTTSTTTRSYVQKNAMTRLSWGEARPHIADRALIGRTLFLDRDRNDPTRFRLRIE